jgi:hypothetical protein
MPDQDEIAQQHELLMAHRRRLAHYLGQQAAFGASFVPAAVAEGIRDAREDIRRVKGILCAAVPP